MLLNNRARLFNKNNIFLCLSILHKASNIQSPTKRRQFHKFGLVVGWIMNQPYCTTRI